MGSKSPPSSPTFPIYVFAVNILSKAGKNPQPYKILQTVFKWYYIQDFDNFWLFFFWMCPLLPFVCWHPQFSVNERCYGVTHTGQVLLIWHLQFSSFKFRNVLVPAETVILGSFGLIFGICKPFLTSDGKQDDASDMLQFSEVFRNGLNWAKKNDFLVHFTPYETHPKILPNTGPY